MTTLALSDLVRKHCTACTSGTPALPEPAIRNVLADLPGWELAGGARGPEIAKTYKFANYYETMSFVNAVAWVAHREDHHPDLEVGYNRCKVRYSTHSIGGISENDLICAAKVEGLLAGVSCPVS
jgi:4a-hydroxytetrahydrobiopterin dehydratase